MNKVLLLRSILKTFRPNYSTLVVHPDIQHAINYGKPVIALESTILTHGMPLDKSLNLSKTLQKIAVDNGALAATIAVLDGRIHVGMNESEQAYLIDQAKQKKVRKASVKDIPYAISRKCSCSTTVASTMLIAHKAGIKIFATGGIGGVHREAENTMDISNDLTALSKIPMTVVSAGVKSILDIPKTLEVLETLGVPVYVYKSEEFPAFFTNKSGIKGQQRIESPEEASDIFKSLEQMNISNGMLVTVPIPKKYSADENKIEIAIRDALEKAKRLEITGSRVTPFLLENLREITKNHSIEANIELIKNNVKFAALMAQSYSTNVKKPTARCNKLCVVGGTNIDYHVKINKESVTNVTDLFPPASYSGKVDEIGIGGVGQNISATLSKLNFLHSFLTNIDESGLTKIKQKNINCETYSAASNDDIQNAKYMGVFNAKNDLLFGIADMEKHDGISGDFVEKFFSNKKDVEVILMEGNLSEDCIQSILKVATEKKIKVWFEPTDLHKSYKLQACLKATAITTPIEIMTPNTYELEEMYRYKTGSNLSYEGYPSLVNIIREEFLTLSSNVLLKLGEEGALFVNKDTAVHFTSPVAKDCVVENVSGAGDSLVASVLYMRECRGASWIDSILGGLAVVEMTLSSKSTTHDALNEDCLSHDEIESVRRKVTITHY